MRGTPSSRVRQERRRLARARLGMRRLDRVLIEVQGKDVVCTAFGASHRLPRVRRISLQVAMELAAQGIPTGVVRRGRALPSRQGDACNTG